MKSRKLLFVILLFALSVVVCLFATKWYYNKKYRKKAIDEIMRNIDYYHALRSTMNEKEQDKHKKILDEFYKSQLKRLAQNLNIKEPNNIDPVKLIQSVEKERYRVISPKEVIYKLKQFKLPQPPLEKKSQKKQDNVNPPNNDKQTKQ
jgi:flagellin-specific chaperone FliS